MIQLLKMLVVRCLDCGYEGSNATHACQPCVFKCGFCDEIMYQYNSVYCWKCEPRVEKFMPNIMPMICVSDRLNYNSCRKLPNTYTHNITACVCDQVEDVLYIPKRCMGQTVLRQTKK